MYTVLYTENEMVLVPNIKTCKTILQVFGMNSGRVFWTICEIPKENVKFEHESTRKLQ